MAQISGYTGAPYPFTDYFQILNETEYSSWTWDSSGRLDYVEQNDVIQDHILSFKAKQDIPRLTIETTLYLRGNDTMVVVGNPLVNGAEIKTKSTKEPDTTTWVATYEATDISSGATLVLPISNMMEYDQVSYTFYFSPEASKTYRVTAWVADNESSISRLNIINNKAEWFTNEVGFSNGVMTLNIPLIDEQGKEYDKSKYLDVGFIVFIPPANIRFTSSPQVSINGDADYFNLYDTRGDVFSGYFNKDCLYVLKFANTLTNNGVSTRKRNQMIVLNV